MAATTLHSFAGSPDGENLYAGLTPGHKHGNFYGTSSYGGKGGYGTIFEVTNTGGFASLYSFSDGSNGASPSAGLTLWAEWQFLRHNRWRPQQHVWHCV